MAHTIGDKNGRLTIVERADDYIDSAGRKRKMWRCICDCGNVVTVRDDSLTPRHTVSCGCHHKEAVSKAAAKTARLRTKYGDSSGRLYNIWYLMRQRCNNQSNPAYPNYGGRGITVCDEWNDQNDGYPRFKSWALSNGYNDKLTIDRAKNNEGYSPCNCRWVTVKVQNRNRRNTVRLKYGDDDLTIPEWANRLGVTKSMLYARYERGMSVEEILFKPHRKSSQKMRNILDG